MHIHRHHRLHGKLARDMTPRERRIYRRAWQALALVLTVGIIAEVLNYRDLSTEPKVMQCVATGVDYRVCIEEYRRKLWQN